MEFLDWRIYGFFFSFINVMFRALYIGITRTKVLTINAIVMALTNVVLDYALIFGKFGLPEMGIKGAAIASVLAEASSILFFVIYTYATVDLKKYHAAIFPVDGYLVRFLRSRRTVGTTGTGDCQYRPEYLCRIADSGQRTGYDYQQSCQQCYWYRRHPARDAAH